ncbi:DUF2148 domain-containing protein [Dehalobacter sp. DCM]|uniref:ferredoxin domain-containing protein n=1 Tax=Dehalobacter sp. DCM TaxID=2907827 RepID=UPI00308210B8|nr:DUF2148 domain-containing protein [Dehalobacter sp. DCM]
MDIMKTVAELMALSAVTAPKAKGQDCIEAKVITDPKILAELADAMALYSEEPRKKFFLRDSENIRNSQALLLLSVKDNKPAGLNCGACGQPECTMLTVSNEGPEFPGPLCAWRAIDLGIAIGSAAKTAGMLNADNRVLYSVGVVVKKIGLMQGAVVVGIPINAAAKNIYFDRTF